jgi:hypothetical protein
VPRRSRVSPCLEVRLLTGEGVGLHVVSADVVALEHVGIRVAADRHRDTRFVTADAVCRARQPRDGRTFAGSDANYGFVEVVYRR